MSVLKFSIDKVFLLLCMVPQHIIRVDINCQESMAWLFKNKIGLPLCSFSN